MRFFKIAIYTVAAFFALMLIAALFVKKEYHVERSISINKDKSTVFNYIKQLKNQDHYSKWAMMDPNMKKTYTGTDATVGFISAWDSDNPEVGKGEQEIISIKEGERIDFELRFIEPFEAVEPAYMTTEALSENETQVKWGFSGHMAYPFNLWLLFIDFEEMIGNDLETGLTKLKSNLEETSNE